MKDFDVPLIKLACEQVVPVTPSRILFAAQDHGDASPGAIDEPVKATYEPAATSDLSVVVDGAVALDVDAKLALVRKRACEHAARMRHIELDAAFRCAGELRLAVRTRSEAEIRCGAAAEPRKEDAQRAAT